MFHVRKPIGIRKSSMSTLTTTRKNRGWTRTARNCIPIRITMSEETQNFTVLRCFACAKKISESCGITAAFRQHGQSPTSGLSRTTHRQKNLYHVHGNRGEDPTEPAASSPYP